MSEHYEHPNPNLMDDPAASPLILGSILGVILTLVTIIASAALYFERARSYEAREMSKTTTNPVVKIQAEQRTQLASGVRWVNKEKQVVGVPIDLAIKLVAKEYSSDGAAAAKP